MFGRKKKKQSFFEKLTGAVAVDEFDDMEYEDEMPQSRHAGYPHHEDDTRRSVPVNHPENDYSAIDTNHNAELMEEEPDGQLSVDVINTPDAIIIRSMLAGVKPGDIDVDITRDMVTIKGTREEYKEDDDEEFFHQELYWGSFSRNILLPEEIDVDEAEAAEKHGLLTLRLPKLDKNRKTKVHVKAK